MPHFKTKTFIQPTFPLQDSCSGDSFIFVDRYYSSLYPKLSIILTKYQSTNQKQTQEFLIEVKEKENQTLIKCNKESKIAPIEIPKNALRILSKNQQVISHNLNSQNITSDLKLPFIQTINNFIDFDSFLKTNNLQNKQIWLEIGFGSGRNLLYNAQHNKDILHIGVEIHTPSLEQVARQIGLLNLNNIYILSYDARIFLELLPSNNINRILVHFPIPWDKSPHRRIFSNTFLKEANRILKQNGTLELRTDSEEYFLYAKSIANKEEWLIHESCNKDSNIISKYEARWKKMQKNIYDLILTAKINSDFKNSQYDFSFKDINFISDTLNSHDFKRCKIIKDGYFVSIEDLFISKFNDKILKVSFGDFNYPENRYIIIDNEIRYLKSQPLPTNINQKCHNILCDLLFKER